MLRDEDGQLSRISAGLVVRPGDILIVAHPGRINAARAAEIKAKLRDRLPGLSDVVIIGDGMTVAAFRPDPEDSHAAS
jgi:hypothetical protein